MISKISLAVLFSTSLALAQSEGEPSCDLLAESSDLQLCQQLENDSLWPTLTNGISGDLCGYHTYIPKCHYNTGHRTVTIPGQRLVRKDNHHTDPEIRNYCQTQGKAWVTKNRGYTLESASYTGLYHGRDCNKSDWKGKCNRWYMNTHFDCSIKVYQKKYDANASKCTPKTDYNNPKTCEKAFQQDARQINNEVIQMSSLQRNINEKIYYLKLLKINVEELAESNSRLGRLMLDQDQLNSLKDINEYLQNKVFEDPELMEISYGVQELSEVVDALSKNQSIHKKSRETEEAKEYLKDLEMRISILDQELISSEHLVGLIDGYLGKLRSKSTEIQIKMNKLK